MNNNPYEYLENKRKDRINKRVSKAVSKPQIWSESAMVIRCPACGNEGIHAIHACCGGMEFEPLPEEFGKAIDENFWEIVDSKEPLPKYLGDWLATVDEHLRNVSPVDLENNYLYVKKSLAGLSEISKIDQDLGLYPNHDKHGNFDPKDCDREESQKEEPVVISMFMSDRFYEEHFTDLVKTLGMDHFHRADKEEENQNEN